MLYHILWRIHEQNGFKRKARTFLVFLTVLILLASSACLLVENFSNMTPEHRVFRKSFKTFAFVPKIFGMNSGNNFWASTILVDRRAKKLFCVPQISAPQSLLEVFAEFTPCSRANREVILNSGHEKDGTKTDQSEVFFARKLFECYHSYPFYDDTDKNVWKSRHWEKIEFVVEPIRGFISHFIEMCVLKKIHQDNLGEAKKKYYNVCLGCDSDMGCLIDKFHDIYKLLLDKNEVRSFWRGIYSLFPQFWSCGNVQLYHFYEKVAALEQKQTYWLRYHRYFQSFEPDNEHFLSTGWGPDKKQSLEQRDDVLFSDRIFNEHFENAKLQLSKDLKRTKKLVTIYAIDYFAFNVRLPHWLEEACPECYGTLIQSSEEYRAAAKKHSEL